MTQDARIQQMLEYLPVEELSPEDIKFLRWIAEWGDETTEKNGRDHPEVQGEPLPE